MGFRFWTAFWPIIALGFPVLELVGIYRVWQYIGVWTLLWLLLAAVLGLNLLASERANFLPRLAQSMQAGTHPFELIKTSGQRFLAGVLLIIPGVISDVIALGLLLNAQLTPRPTPAPTNGEAAERRESDVIDGEWRRLD